MTTFGVVSELFLYFESQLLSAISALDFVSIGLCDFGSTQIPILSFHVPWIPPTDVYRCELVSDL